MNLDKLLESLQFKKGMWSNLESQFEQRCSRLRGLNLVRTEIELIRESKTWEISNYGFLVLPMNQLYLNPNFENLDGGILAFQVSNRDGLDVFAQSSSILRVSKVRKLKFPLLHFITSEITKLPVLYSKNNVPLRVRKSIGVKNVNSYENLFSYF